MKSTYPSLYGLFYSKLTDIGLKSDNVFGFDTFKTGVTIAVNQLEGTTPERME
jgi:hypothetical protein